MASQPSLTYSLEGPNWDESQIGIQESQNSLGYLLIEPETEFRDFSANSLVNFPLPFLKGFVRASYNHLSSRDYNEKKAWPYGNIQEVEIGDQMRPIMITEPNPDHINDMSSVITEVMHMGWTELDEGTHRKLHEAMAKMHPDRRVLSFMTPGISKHGPVLKPLEGFTRLLKTTAEEYLEVLPQFTYDGSIHLNGTSLGSIIAFLAAAENMSRNPFKQLNITRLKLISPAIGARDVNRDEKFSEFDASDSDYIWRVTLRFFGHMAIDAPKMALRNPEIAGECASVGLIYATQINKHLPRALTLMGNLRDAQKGIDYQLIKDIVGYYDSVDILAGQNDPLFVEQKPQFNKVSEFARKLQIRELAGYGHSLSLDSKLAIDQLDKMEQAA